MSEESGSSDAVSEKPELVFGLVGAAGTDLNKVARLLASELCAVGYKTEILVLSSLISALPRFADLKSLEGGPEDIRIRECMKAGNKLRSILENGDAVVRLAITRIRNIRQQTNDDPSKPIDSQVYVVKSLKHRSEYECLANLYGDRFTVISVYEPKTKRISNLAKRIAKSHNKAYGEEFFDTAEELINIDEMENDLTLGQQVRKVFPLADIFVSFDDTMHAQLHRFVQILFQAPYRTPTRDEYGMFHARAAALRSADLSRQVGAVIATEEGEIIAAGCNEVPKAGGGSVWEREVDSTKDYRDFRIGHDSSAAMKLEIVTEVFEVLKNNGWLSPGFADEEPRRLAERSLCNGTLGDDKGILVDKKIANILEYGRIVHAEMSAITDAVRRGFRTKDSVLYCTTFPCHMRARHIMAAGIGRVVYIEPYPKSMTKDLYQRSIQIDGDANADPDAVRFEAFVGVAPRRYLTWFEMPPVRKDSRGYALREDVHGGIPRVAARFALPSDLEAGYEDSLQTAAYGLFRDSELTAGSDDDGAASRGLARTADAGSKERNRVMAGMEKRGSKKRGQSQKEKRRTVG